ncbi:putative inorganic phosphate cotransporter-like protein [Operophtera brumata]|uniref:Putative inorganic phosphate cotransporter-like protein n=1 Tax=Operophtera brumata TaxID=104452 RepID=A0A0L7KSL4_OPEBR|nr:putative inorganic phosphate cotransporter-like protein [Operophtera brumata]
MIFLGYFLIYLVRYNLSVHIVGMAQLSNREAVDIISWDDMKIGKLFSAYHIGFCVCFPIFHSFGDRIGPTWLVGITGLISGVLSCLTPASAYFNFWALFMHWVPPTERNHFMWAYCGKENKYNLLEHFQVC